MEKINSKNKTNTFNLTNKYIHYLASWFEVENTNLKKQNISEEKKTYSLKYVKCNRNSRNFRIQGRCSILFNKSNII